jgi:hypothetical protein
VHGEDETSQRRRRQAQPHAAHEENHQRRVQRVEQQRDRVEARCAESEDLPLNGEGERAERPVDVGHR